MRSIILWTQAMVRRLTPAPEVVSLDGSAGDVDLRAGGDELGAARRFMAAHWQEEAS